MKIRLKPTINSIILLIASLVVIPPIALIYGVFQIFNFIMGASQETVKSIKKLYEPQINEGQIKDDFAKYCGDDIWEKHIKNMQEKSKQN